ncbi:DUF3892 domain-containing protein [Subtercola frigoramans]|uniref:DUF3892 domain-containing protein n=1 Tax=Subtercola frigoramans TaxID=120298 RepID=A0ABS2L5Z3_9MICO|nr:DUF3892 domain-containing protein [Subtercola frigoramans]MBM7472487.1 hypothetical protein [Subtercola frigoramans]
MSIQITHVRFAGTTKVHESIIRYKWKSIQDGSVGDNDKPSLVAWVDTKTNKAYVGTGAQQVAVGAIHPATSPAYLKTHADGVWTNNLLSLPTF